MIDLETALFEIGEHLDHPAGDQILAAVLDRIARPDPPAVRDRRRRLRVLVAVAATVAVITAAVVTIAPARNAIADWLGIGAAEIHHSNGPRPPNGATPVPGARGPRTGTPRPDVARRLAAARTVATFVIATPRDASAGALQDVVVDTRVKGGLVALDYPGFTLVEIAAYEADGRPLLGKILDPAARVVNVTVAGAPGMWITGAHVIGYLDRNGNFRTDTVRRSGPVLLWVRAGVTYRIEGPTRLPVAQALARSIR